MGNKRKILIFNVNWLGDVLFSTAVIRNIKYNFPDSFISCIVPPSCRQVLEGNRHLDEIIVFDEKGEHKGILAKIKFIGLLKSKGFDMVFLLHRSLSRALIARLAGIPERIGYDTKKRGFLLTRKIVPPAADSMRRIDYYLYLVEKAGYAVKDRFTEFEVSDEDIKAAGGFLRENEVSEKDFLVGLNPGGNWGPKRWPAENFSQVADRLRNEFGAKVVITGAAQDLPLAQMIQKGMRSKAVIACGKLNLKQFGALCKRLDLFVSADSGPLHIANAAGAKRIIALFGPTDPAITGPYPPDNVNILRKDTGCRIPCYNADCRDYRCMQAITPEDVIEQTRLFRKQKL